LVVKPGDVLPVKMMHIDVVSADGESIAKPLPGAGEANAACAASPVKPPMGDENDRSIGMIMTFGKTRIMDMGDLTWAKERDLVCPVNKLGKVDVAVVSHHGTEYSNSPAFLDAVAPRIAMIDNSGRKGAVPTTIDTLRGSGRLQDLWQLHTAEGNDAAHNVAESHIANLPGPDSGNYLKLTVHPDGSMAMTNPRTGETVNYPAK
jgi:hypothetical protein